MGGVKFFWEEKKNFGGGVKIFLGEHKNFFSQNARKIFFSAGKSRKFSMIGGAVTPPTPPPRRGTPAAAEETKKIENFQPPRQASAYTRERIEPNFSGSIQTEPNR